MCVCVYVCIDSTSQAFIWFIDKKKRRGWFLAAYPSMRLVPHTHLLVSPALLGEVLARDVLELCETDSGCWRREHDPSNRRCLGARLQHVHRPLHGWINAVPLVRKSRTKNEWIVNSQRTQRYRGESYVATFRSIPYAYSTYAAFFS